MNPQKFAIIFCFLLLGLLTNGESEEEKSSKEESNSKESGSKERGSKESDSKEGGSKESGSKESDSRESGSKESGSKESGSNESGSSEENREVKEILGQLIEILKGIERSGCKLRGIDALRVIEAVNKVGSIDNNTELDQTLESLRKNCNRTNNGRRIGAGF